MKHLNESNVPCKKQIPFTLTVAQIVTFVGQVTIMFVTLEKIAAQDPKYADILLLENYAAFQNRYSSQLNLHLKICICRYEYSVY